MSDKINELLGKNKGLALSVNILLSIIIFLVLLVGVEILCRLFYDKATKSGYLVWPELNSFSMYRLDNSFINKSDGLSYRLSDGRLNEDIYTFFDKKKIKKDKEDGVFRVVVLGDSYTIIPIGIDWIKFYVPQLEELLKGEWNIRGLKKRFEILPFAQSGLNTYQEYLLLKNLAINYDPDLVILQYTYNDVEPIRLPMQYRGSNGNVYLSFRSKTDVLAIGNAFFPAFPHLDKKINTFLLENSAFFRFLSFRLNTTLEKFFNNFVLDKSSSFESIGRIKQIAKGKNIPFIMATLPSSRPPNECLDNSYSETFFKELKPLADRLAIPIFNLCDYVDDISQYSPKPGDGHYNTAGYGFVAKMLKDAILKEVAK